MSGLLLEQRLALITGAGSGIGRATAHLFASEGAGVGIVDLVAEAAEDVAAEIRASGGTALAVQADVRTKQMCAARSMPLRRRSVVWTS